MRKNTETPIYGPKTSVNRSRKRNEKKRKTYQSDTSHDVHGRTTDIIKVELFSQGVDGVVIQDVTDSVETGPEKDQCTQPTMERQNLRVGESKGLKHRAAQDQEQNDATAGNRVVTTDKTDLN